MLARTIVLLGLLLTVAVVALGVALRRIHRDERILARARSELYDARRLAVIGRSAAGMAHDFSNLLTPIIACSELLMARCERDDHRRDLRAIHQAGIRARDLARRLLLDRRREAIRRPVDPTHLLVSLRSFLDQFVGGGIAITFHSERDIPAMLADAAQIERVIINLVANAAEALDEVWSTDRRIAVSLGRELFAPERAHTIKMAHGYYVRITVQDNGPGIREEVRTKIFDPFCSTKPQEVGIGLGLSSVRDIVEQHGGAIIVYSLPRQGTRFDVYLPAIMPAETASSHNRDGGLKPAASSGRHLS